VVIHLRKIKDIKKVIIHCTASDRPEDNQIVKLDELHTGTKTIPWNGNNVECFGFDKIGYHYVMWRDGKVDITRKITQIGAHCKGHNTESVGFCLAGEYEFPQLRLAAEFVYNLCETLGLDPRKDVYPHNKFTDQKTCPNFSMEKFFACYPDVPRDFDELVNRLVKLEQKIKHLEGVDNTLILPGNVKATRTNRGIHLSTEEDTPWWRRLL
jgi:N-acetylmuramoyl-L-alanine amidase